MLEIIQLMDRAKCCSWTLHHYSQIQVPKPTEPFFRNNFFSVISFHMDWLDFDLVCFRYGWDVTQQVLSTCPICHALSKHTISLSLSLSLSLYLSLSLSISLSLSLTHTHIHIHTHTHAHNTQKSRFLIMGKRLKISPSFLGFSISKSLLPVMWLMSIRLCSS